MVYISYNSNHDSAGINRSRKGSGHAPRESPPPPPTLSVLKHKLTRVTWRTLDLNLPCHTNRALDCSKHRRAQGTLCIMHAAY